MASSISVKANPGVSQQQLVERIRPTLGDGIEALTGAAYTAETIDDIGQQFLNFFTTFLTVFAGIALLVASFSVYNTFSILVAQRSRESALLRALGASRRQVIGSMVAEALVVGVVASAAGLFGGVAIAGLLKGPFDSFGFSLPAGGLAFPTSTAVIAMGVGVGVTLLAAAFPAVKASRVPPVAALRESAAEPTAVSAARMVAAGAVLGGAGVAVVLGAVVGGVIGGGGEVLALAGLGAVLTIVGVVVLGPSWPARRRAWSAGLCLACEGSPVGWPARTPCATPGARRAPPPPSWWASGSSPCSPCWRRRSRRRSTTVCPGPSVTTWS